MNVVIFNIIINMKEPKQVHTLEEMGFILIQEIDGLKIYQEKKDILT